jgi:hypothetical protein
MKRSDADHLTAELRATGQQADQKTWKLLEE